MDALLTMLIWLGSGFAFAVGFAAGCGIVFLARRPEDRDMAKRQVELMQDRNDLDKLKVYALNEIADNLKKEKS